MHSFGSTLDFDSGKVGSKNHTQMKFKEATHLSCRGWLCGVQRVFSEQSLQHFWIRTRN